MSVYPCVFLTVYPRISSPPPHFPFLLVRLSVHFRVSQRSVSPWIPPCVRVLSVSVVTNTIELSLWRRPRLEVGLFARREMRRLPFPQDTLQAHATQLPQLLHRRGLERTRIVYQKRDALQPRTTSFSNNYSPVTLVVHLKP